MNEQIVERIENVNKGSVPNGYLKIKACLFPSEWPFTELNRVLIERQERNLKGIYNKDNVLSVSGEHGIVNQISHLGRSYASENLENYLIVYKGDIVYTKSPLKANPYGIIKLNLEETGIVSPLYAVYSTKHIITGKYINYYFQIDSFLNNFLSPYIKRGPKNTMNVGNQDILHGSIPIPTLDEQEKIVLILDLIEKIIKLKQQLIEQERKRKKWLLNKLLAPDVEGNIILRLDQVCKINTDNLSENTDPNFAFYYIDITCVENGKISFPSDRVMFKDAPVRARRKIKKNDILMSSVRPLLHAFAKIDFESSKYIASTGFTVLSPKNEALKEIVYQQLFSEHLNKQYNCLLVGTNYPALNMADIASLRISVPKENIELISKTFSTQDKYIYNLEAELSQWKRKKKFLMQILLTGIVRVLT